MLLAAQSILAGLVVVVCSVPFNGACLYVMQGRPNSAFLSTYTTQNAAAGPTAERDERKCVRAMGGRGRTHVRAHMCVCACVCVCVCVFKRVSVMALFSLFIFSLSSYCAWA